MRPKPRGKDCNRPEFPSGARGAISYRGTVPSAGVPSDLLVENKIKQRRMRAERMDKMKQHPLVMKFRSSERRRVRSTMGALWWWGWVLVRGSTVAMWLVSALLWVSGVQGQTKPREYQVKAAYLYNFGKFVQWPPRTAEAKNDPFRICVLGQNPFGVTLDVLPGQTINGQSVSTRQIPRAQDAEKCDVLFVSTSEQGHVRVILEVVQNLPVLTVSDMPHFVARGGMIEFLAQHNKVRFAVNRAAAERAGLSLSSELLKLAVNVKTSP
jgi:YfiR/HmsC-like